MPLLPLVAVTPNEYDDCSAPAGDVTVNVEVPDAPTASDSDEVVNVPVQPGGIAGSVRASVNVPLAQLPLSLFVTVTVYARPLPAVPDCDDGESATVGVARTHGVVIT